MATFSSQKPDSKKSDAIPQEILSSVSIMGDAPRADAIEAAPATQGTLSSTEVSQKREEVPMTESAPSSGNAPFGAPEKKESPLQMTEPAPRPTQKGISLPKMPKVQGNLLIFGGIGLLLVLILGGVALFLFRSGDSSKETVQVPEENLLPPAPEPAPALPPFALDKANYVSFNTETDTAATIQEKISSAGAKIVEAKVSSPVEFVVTDQNNNPLAFSRFAYLLDLPLPTDFLSGINEGFSFFLYSDNGQTRIALKLSFREGSSPENLLSGAETDLPAAFANLFYGKEATAPRKVTFRSGAYGSTTVNFVNIDGEKNLSFDYALVGKEWFAGNSKNALRTVLDQELKQQ